MPSAPESGPVPVGPPPPSVVTAVRLMFVRAAVALIGAIVTFAMKNDLRSAIRDANPNASEDRINTLYNTAIAVGIVVAAIFIVLYLLLALQVRKGKNWARIVTWIVAGFGVIDAFSSLAQTTTSATQTISIVVGVIDVAIIVMLSQRRSSYYFAKRPR
jgi:hypothetical protein